MFEASGLFATLLQDDSGQDLIEYALVAGMIGIGAIVAVGALSTNVKTALNDLGSSLTKAI